MITVKASQKLFTFAEVTNLTGICGEHLENLTKHHRLGFTVRAVETQGNETGERFFSPWDLMVLATLFPRCAHQGRRSLHGMTSQKRFLQSFTLWRDRKRQTSTPHRVIEIASSVMGRPVERLSVR